MNIEFENGFITSFPNQICTFEHKGKKLHCNVDRMIEEYKKRTEKLCSNIENFREKAGMTERSVKKEQLINWKILKQSEGQLLATNAYALLTSDYFPFSKTQCAVFKGTDRADCIMD